MPRLILTSRYLKPGKPGRISNYVQYIATRPGVEQGIPQNRDSKPTDKQREFIQELLKVFPDAGTYPEYHDYYAQPSKYFAGEFISAVIDHNIEMIQEKQNFVDYISTRPGVEKSGTHGLFSQTDDPISISSIQKEVGEYQGNIYTHVISIRREDAERLGYQHAEAWRNMLRANVGLLAQCSKIKLENLRWYAAFHNESYHPHVHLMVFSKDPMEGYLSKQGIEKLRSVYANTIFKDELNHIYDQQTSLREQLCEEERLIVREIIKKLETDNNTGDKARKIGELLVLLNMQLKEVNGKKVYGYLPKKVKKTVDGIAYELSKIEPVQLLYKKWCTCKENILGSYTDFNTYTIPLEQQKEFRKIKNDIIRQALNLQVCLKDVSDIQASEKLANDTNLSSLLIDQTASLIRHLGKMVAKDYMRKNRELEKAVDRKLKQQALEKQTAHGIRVR